MPAPLQSTVPAVMPMPLLPNATYDEARIEVVFYDGKGNETRRQLRTIPAITRESAAR